jgi:hypothetical protein
MHRHLAERRRDMARRTKLTAERIERDAEKEVSGHGGPKLQQKGIGQGVGGGRR